MVNAQMHFNVRDQSILLIGNALNHGDGEWLESFGNRRIPNLSSQPIFWIPPSFAWPKRNGKRTKAYVGTRARGVIRKIRRPLDSGRFVFRVELDFASRSEQSNVLTIARGRQAPARLVIVATRRSELRYTIPCSYSLG